MQNIHMWDSTRDKYRKYVSVVELWQFSSIIRGPFVLQLNLTKKKKGISLSTQAMPVFLFWHWPPGSTSKYFYQYYNEASYCTCFPVPCHRSLNVRLEQVPGTFTVSIIATDIFVPSIFATNIFAA